MGDCPIHRATDGCPTCPETPDGMVMYLRDLNREIAGKLAAALAREAELRQALTEIAGDHEPEPLVGRQERAWCHCGNWAPYNCTAAIARAALAGTQTEAGEQSDA